MNKKQKILIIEARFYEDLADEMKAGAIEVLDREGRDYDVVSVPGALEIPGAVAMAEKSGKYAGYIALGCVIRGETSHYDYVCGESIHGLQRLATEKALALGTGILTVENREQAEARASRKKGNKGAASAEACISLIKIRNGFSGPGR